MELFGRERKPRLRQRAGVLFAALGMLGLVVGFGTTASAVHDVGIFQLDGNASTAANSTPPALEDWDLICKAHPGQCTFAPGYSVPSGTTTAKPSSFVVDPSQSATDDILKGGTKDDNDINSWSWASAQPSPPKNDITHAYAAEYVCNTAACTTQNIAGHKLLYFGGDRLSNNGSANLAFWFFQDKVTETANGPETPPTTCVTSSGCPFGGQHTVGNVSLGGSTPGDILIISAFGPKAAINVYEWVGVGNATKPCFTNSCSLQPLLVGSSACDPLATGDAACAVVNDTTQPSPWTIPQKGAPANSFAPTNFFEGGVDLTRLKVDACFSSFLLNTRASAAGDAELHDKVIGQFARCGANLVTNRSQGTIDIGQSLTDSATITTTGSTKAPTGVVSFFACGPGVTTCATTGTAFDTKNLSGAVVSGSDYTVTSASFTPNAAGTWCFAASWPGDTNYQQQGGFRDPGTNECFTVNPRQPAIVTHQTAGPIPIGSATSDTATLTNTAPKPNGSPAGGTIVFTAFGPRADPTVAACTAAKLVFTSSAFTVSGDSPPDYGPASFTPTTAGTYDWVATYSGDSPNTLGVTSNCGDEASVIAPRQPAIVTHQTAGPVPLGSAISDTATLTNTAPKANGNPAGGTIVFTAFGPRADPNVAVCTAAKLVFTSSSFTVSGNSPPDYGPASFTPTAAGTYDWIATYSGDSPNTLGVSSNCGDEASVIISLQPSMTTAQRFRPNDSATVSVASGAGNLSGSVRFQLFVNSTTCSNTAVYDSGSIDITTGTPNSGTPGLTKTVTTNNLTEYVTTGTQFSWLVTYTSTNTGHKNVTASCNAENSSITINNGGTFNTP